jgi:hypothetical protein
VQAQVLHAATQTAGAKAAALTGKWYAMGQAAVVTLAFGESVFQSAAAEIFLEFANQKFWQVLLVGVPEHGCNRARRSGRSPWSCTITDLSTNPAKPDF